MDYEVLRDGFVEGTWRKKGEVIKGTERAMRYLVLAGQVAKKQATEEAAPAAAAAEEAPAAGEPSGGGRGGKRR